MGSEAGESRRRCRLEEGSVSTTGQVTAGGTVREAY